MLFADDAAVTSHTEQELQHLMDRFSQACKDFGLTISLKKTNVLSQYVDTPPAICIDDYQLEVVHQFAYLGSTISDNLSLDAEINKRNCYDPTGRLTTRVWENQKLTTSTKVAVYNACIVSTLLYGSKTWATYSKQKCKLSSFHLRCLCGILGIRWSDKVNKCPGSRACRSSYHIHTAQATQTSVARPCAKDGGWTHPQRHPLR